MGSFQSGASAEPLITIEAPRPGFRFNFKELWQYRELIYFFAWREVMVRYKQTVFGLAWAIMQPLFSLLVFTVFFGRIAKIPSDGVPYSVFAFSGLAPWLLFSNGMTQASNSLVSNANMLAKTYFPRLILPMSFVVAGLMDFAVSFTILTGLAAYHGFYPTARILVIPFLVVFVLLSSFSISLWMSCLNVRYRDVRYTLPFIVQLWMYATPIVYSSRMVGEKWQWLLSLNPMVMVVDGFRWAILGLGVWPRWENLVSIGLVLLLLVGGLLFFSKMEDSFADYV